MKIKKITRGKGEWILRLDKQMYKHLNLIPGYEYVWIILGDNGELIVRRVEDMKMVKEEVKRDDS